MKLYPDNEHARFVATQSEIVRELQDGESMPACFVCEFKGSGDYEFVFGNQAAWQELDSHYNRLEVYQNLKSDF